MSRKLASKVLSITVRFINLSLLTIMTAEVVAYYYGGSSLPFSRLLSFANSGEHGWAKKRAVETPLRMGALTHIPNTVKNWPPQLGSEFPKVRLFDHRGQLFDVETLRGKPTLIEFIAMTCAACQAWSGGHERGAFDDFAIQADLESIEKYFSRYTGGLSLFSDSLNFVQLIVYNTNLEAPTAPELEKWRAHFQFNTHPNTHVVTGGEALRNRDSFFRTPGFLLLDKNLVIRFDALGHQPRHNLYTELLPAVPALLSSR